MSLNRVELSGTLAKDPELRFTKGGAAQALFTIAVNGNQYDPERREQVVTTNWIRVQAWHEAAVTCAEGLEKGDEVVVLGELDQWTTKLEDGTTGETHTRVRAWSVVVTRKKKPSAPSTPEPERPF